MDASQRFLEEIENLIQDEVSHYEYDEEIALALKEMHQDYSVPIIVLIEANLDDLPKVEGYTQKIGGVLKYNNPYFFEVEYINQPDEFPIFMHLNKIDCDTYLDYINLNQILKPNESILQRIYQSKSI